MYLAEIRVYTYVIDIHLTCVASKDDWIGNLADMTIVKLFAGRCVENLV